MCDVHPASCITQTQSLLCCMLLAELQNAQLHRCRHDFVITCLAVFVCVCVFAILNIKWNHIHNCDCILRDFTHLQAGVYVLYHARERNIYGTARDSFAEQRCLMTTKTTTTCDSNNGIFGCKLDCERCDAANDVCFTCVSNNRDKRRAQAVAEVTPSKSDRNFQSMMCKTTPACDRGERWGQRGRAERGERKGKGGREK